MFKISKIFANLRKTFRRHAKHLSPKKINCIHVSHFQIINLESGYCLTTKGFNKARPKSPIVTIECQSTKKAVSLKNN